jgi:ribosomal protein L4
VPKTKQMVNELQGYKGNKRLIISKEVKEVSELASRNIQNLKIYKLLQG